jgi:beta-lactamase regulating signal transducer with metallopeptidase domain
MNLAWIYAFNVLVNSVLAFLTVALLVKFLLWAFRMKQPRIQALALSLPLFKVGFDFFLYNFSRWALSSQINPLLCSPGSRAINVSFTYPTSLTPYPFSSGIYFSVEGGKTFTIADVIALSIDPLWIKTIVTLAFAVSVGLGGLRLLQALKARKQVKEILQTALPCLRIVSCAVEAALKKSKVQICISTKVDVPCAVGRSIIFPQNLIQTLSQAEFEAICVHELDHLRWKDSLLRAAQATLSTLFWWIPTKRWQSRLELAQELACDATITQFNLLPIDLASALAKAARGAKTGSPCLPVMYFIERGRLLGRIKALVKPPSKRSLGIRIAQCIAIFSLLTVIFFGQFWIF